MPAARTLYEVLSLGPAATTDEVRKAYHALAKRHHPDRFAPGEEKRKAEELFTAMTEAFNVLTDPVRRKDYDEKLRGQASGESAAQKEAKNYFRAGASKLSAGEHQDAIRLFKAAVHLDPSEGPYHAHLAQALAKAASYGEAARAWEEAIRREPYNAKYCRLAGECLEQGGMKSRAKRMYEMALKWDKNDAKAADGLKRVGGDDRKGGLFGALFKKG